MSDHDKPDLPPAPPEGPPPAADRPPEDKADRVQLLRDKAAGRANPKVVGKVPSLHKEQTYGFGKKIDAFDDEMERQLQEAMGGFSDRDLYGEGQQRGKRGQADAGPKKGKVYRIHGADVFIDLPGGRTQGVLPLLQFPDGPPALGTEVEVHIQGFDNANGVLLLSRQGAAAVDADWDSVSVGMTVEARVTATNKGGLSVDVNGIRGFMPMAQIDLYRVENAEQFVNQRLVCMVTEVDREERNLVVSRRALLEKDREENREKLWGEIAVGQVRQGVVRSVKDFGAFIDLGGLDGLLHVSEMSWQRVQDAGTVVQPGQSVKVVVLKIDAERRKVSLGMKQLMASPWDAAVANYPAGQVVTGRVSRLMEFGAFVELEPGIEGLIHISELAPQRVRRVADVVKEGQEVQVRVLNVDPGQKRMSLSLKAALAKEPEPESATEAESEPEEPVRPPRPRTTPLRGGLGGGGLNLPMPPGGEPPAGEYARTPPGGRGSCRAGGATRLGGSLALSAVRRRR